jgi:heme a synthase
MVTAAHPHDDGRALHRLALVCASATFVLIFVGGLVTSTGSALAVPDWPLAFGKLIPAWQGGIRFEFGHRVVAGVVVMLTLALASVAARRESRGWVRRCAYAAFAIIIVQAVLGGITVLFELPLAIAVAHAATAQALFCLMVAIAIFTNPRWERTAHMEEPSARLPLAMLAALTTAVVYVQILIGALMRHLGAGLVIPDFPLSFGAAVPPFWDIYIAVNFAHRIGALVVSVMIVWTVARVLREHREVAALRRPALALLLLLAAQVSLGAITIWSGRAVLPTTSHVAIGAAVLATSFALTLMAWHLFGIRHAVEVHDRTAASTGARSDGYRVTA